MLPVVIRSMYPLLESRETVQIVLTLAALNDLEVKASDIQNAYLTAPCSEGMAQSWNGVRSQCWQACRRCSGTVLIEVR
jgi:hypothetical protein